MTLSCSCCDFSSAVSFSARGYDRHYILALPKVFVLPRTVLRLLKMLNASLPGHFGRLFGDEGEDTTHPP